VPLSVSVARAVYGASHRELQASIGFTTVSHTDARPLSTN